MPETLRAREKRIADGSFTSSSLLSVIEDVMGFPGDMQGLVVYDIGSGASSAVLELWQRGAQAYGVDPGYKNASSLLVSARRYLRRPHEDPDYIKHQLAAMQAFERDYSRNRFRYKTALAGELPFEDNSADIVFSELAISHFLVGDKDVLFQAVDEGIRVLKPSEPVVPKERRSLILHPWKSPRSTQSQLENQRALEDSLRQRGIPFTIEAIRNVPEASPRLRIVKP